MTTKELVENIIDAEHELFLTDDENEKILIQERLESLHKQMVIKIDNIDDFVLTLNLKIAKIDSKIYLFKNELTRMNEYKKSIERSKKYFEEILLPMAIKTIGKDGVLQTDVARYKLYETFGPTIIVNEQDLPDEYWKKETVVTINKAKLRKDCIGLYNTKGAAELPNVAYVKRIQKVRRT